MKYFMLLIFISGNLILAQQHKSIHQIEWEAHRGYLHKLTAKQQDIRPAGLIPLQSTESSGLSARVFGFLPDWEYPGALGNLQYDLLTHIACFDFSVNANGSIANPGGWPWIDLINAAHRKGVKVILTAVNFNADEIHGIISDASIKQAFFKNLKSKMAAYSLDGVNVDFESLRSSDKGKAINGFMGELTQTIHTAFPGSEVSFDGPAVNWNGYWDLKGLSDACDYIFIMGYAFSGSWSDFSASTAPLTGGSYNITNTVLNQYGAVTFSQPEKLILGVPYYGQKFQTASDAPHAAVESSLGAAFFRSSVGGFKSYGLQWDDETQSPWFRYQSAGKWYQTWMDNDSSISAKFALARSNNLSGVGMWALNYDGAYTDLWNVIRRHFLQGVTPIPAEPYAPYMGRGSDDSSLVIRFHAVSYAEGYRIYYGRDGLHFPDSVEISNAEATIGGLSADSLYYFKIRAFNSAGVGPATSVLAGRPGSGLATILIVDGFDRQSSTTNPRNFIRQHAGILASFGTGVVSASNEAVESGDVALQNFNYVDWFLGDESTADNTFTHQEQQRVKSYLEQGGNLLVSGSEIGWDLVAKGSDGDKSFYQNYLKAVYIADAPNGDAHTFYSVDGLSDTPFNDLHFDFDNGTHGTFDVDWPDAIKAVNGNALGFKYRNVASSAGGAGVYYHGVFGNSQKKGGLVHLSVPVETIYPESARRDLLTVIFHFFDFPTVLYHNSAIVPTTFALLPNAPNPFNPETDIRFIAPKSGQVTVTIFNSLGQVVRSSGKLSIHAGNGYWRWNGRDAIGHFVAAGSYLYSIRFEQNGKNLVRYGKMIMIK